MLRHLGKGLLLGLGLAVILGSPVQAANVEYGFDFASAYVWRGLSVVDGGVWQPSFTLSHDSGFSFNTWGNYDIDDVNGRDGEFSEVDLTANYSLPLDGIVGVDIGVIEYLFPNSGGFNDATTEFYAGLSWDTVAAPFVTAYYDFDAVDDFYVSFGVGFGGDLSESVAWELGLTAAYAGEDFAAFYAGGTDGGLFDGLAKLAISTEIDDNWGFGVFVAYADSLDSKVLPDQQVDFFGGVSISASF